MDKMDKIAKVSSTNIAAGVGTKILKSSLQAGFEPGRSEFGLFHRIHSDLTRHLLSAGIEGDKVIYKAQFEQKVDQKSSSTEFVHQKVSRTLL